jgi:hypothetical protein
MWKKVAIFVLRGWYIPKKGTQSSTYGLSEVW